MCVYMYCPVLAMHLLQHSYNVLCMRSSSGVISMCIHVFVSFFFFTLAQSFACAPWDVWMLSHLQGEPSASRARPLVCYGVLHVVLFIVPLVIRCMHVYSVFGVFCCYYV